MTSLEDEPYRGPRVALDGLPEELRGGGCGGERGQEHGRGLGEGLERPAVDGDALLAAAPRSPQCAEVEHEAAHRVQSTSIYYLLLATGVE